MVAVSGLRTGDGKHAHPKCKQRLPFVTGHHPCGSSLPLLVRSREPRRVPTSCSLRFSRTSLLPRGRRLSADFVACAPIHRTMATQQRQGGRQPRCRHAAEARRLGTVDRTLRARGGTDV